jgi:diaminopimelate epimerase
MNIEFVKMQGAGNDYIYLDLLERAYRADWSDLAVKISSRHFGVGGDGLVLILGSAKADFRMRMFNADGSEAEMCGNAIRCVGKYLHDRGRLNRGGTRRAGKTSGRRKPSETRVFTIETLAGVKMLEVAKKDRAGRALQLTVDMGRPVLKGADIPVKVDSEPVVGIDVMGYKGTALSMGNPHIVFFVDEITDGQVLGDGPRIENHPLFPKRTNVEFVKVLSRQKIEMRVWERGSGETLACGTGACAAAVASALNGLTGRDVEVKLLGGTLRVEWRETDGAVRMTGPAEEVFSGVYAYTPARRA